MLSRYVPRVVNVHFYWERAMLKRLFKTLKSIKDFIDEDDGEFLFVILPLGLMIFGTPIAAMVFGLMGWL